MNKAIFFDKDGTLVENVPYNVDPSLVTLCQGAGSSLNLLKNDFEFHVVTNQGGVALGLFQEEKLTAIKEKIASLFEEYQAKLSGFHYCPHHPEGSVQEYSIHCECRKPGQQMLTNAAKVFGIDLASSWMIGDILDDVEAGKRAGCRTILIDNGNETEWKINEWRLPDHKVKDLLEAAQIIMKEQRR